MQQQTFFQKLYLENHSLHRMGCRIKGNKDGKSLEGSISCLSHECLDSQSVYYRGRDFCGNISTDIKLLLEFGKQ